MPRRPAPPPPVHAATSTKPKGAHEAAMQKPPPPANKRPAPPRPGPSPPAGGAKPSPSKSAVSPTRACSNPPPRPKKPDLEALRCHIALNDETIARALSRARPPPPRTASGNPPGSPGSPGRSERVSDMSSSIPSSDSLESSQTSGFSLGVTDPSPSRRHQDPEKEEESSEEEEEEQEVEEEDYGMALEADLEMRLRPSLKLRKARVGVALSGGSFILPKALKGRFRKVSGALSSLVTPEKRAVRRVTELSRDQSSYFGSLVQDYISFVQENRSCHSTALDFLQTLRQFLTQMKAYLLQSSELRPPIGALIPEEQIDAVLEKSMHKCVLKPLKGVVDVILHSFQVNSGTRQQLKDNLLVVKMKLPQELGMDVSGRPDGVTIERIRHKFVRMRKTYSPEKKVALLLRACKLIYTSLEEDSDRMCGADHFLPMLTYIVAQCDLPELDLEIQYMMELLDPSLLQGEGGYYLTSVYGAISIIKNYSQQQAAARVLSSDTRDTLHQWHQRRTTQCAAPSVDDLQNILCVFLLDSSCTPHTVTVHPFTTTEEVCRLCAAEVNVADPENYALFLVTADTQQQLATDTHPQRIKAELRGRPQARGFHFLYCRVAAQDNTLNKPRLQSAQWAEQDTVTS